MVIGDFDKDAFIGALGVTPTTVGAGGVPHRFRSELDTWTDITYGDNREYCFNINDMIRETLAALFDKADILKRLREEMNVKYYLVSSPKIISSSRKIKPILSLDRDIMAFLCDIGADYDLDYYVY